jgi:hypothetical protein
MIQTSTRADRRRSVRAAQKAAKLKRKPFGIANLRLEAIGRPIKARDQRKPAKPGTLGYMLDAQDAGKLDQFTAEQLAPFLHELRRRAYIITKRKTKFQLGIGKYWPSGKHKNCDKKGISPKRFTGELAESEAA